VRGAEHIPLHKKTLLSKSGVFFMLIAVFWRFLRFKKD